MWLLMRFLHALCLVEMTMTVEHLLRIYHLWLRRSPRAIYLPETVRGAHARGYNRCSLGICYEGGIGRGGQATDTRTPKQKHALYELLKQLHRDYPQARIIGHRELPHVAKTCPGFTASTEYADLQPENS